MQRSAVVDEFRPLPSGGFLVTMMGSNTGGAPGAVSEFDRNLNAVGEYPTGATDATYPGLNPHGLTIDFANDFFVSTDFILPSSTLAGTTGPVMRNTIRVWGYTNRTLIRTITVPGSQGIMDAIMLPGDPLHTVLTSNGLSSVMRINPFTGAVFTYYDFGTAPAVAMYMAISTEGYLYSSLTLANRVGVLDIRNVNRPTRVDDPRAAQPVLGPHYITLTPDESHLVIADYFLQEGSGGVVNAPADYIVWVVPIIKRGPKKGDLDYANGKQLDFKTLFPSGVAHPHGVKVIEAPPRGHPDSCDDDDDHDGSGHAPNH